MKIDAVQLKHFKSYQNTQVELQSGLNVICGRNGSGKSNFFWAIRFALGEAYSHLSRQERQSLIKDGETFAFVQIKFDNTDRRFPTDNDEMILRRTISLKRDEFTVDSKSAIKSQVANLLEAAGFSNSNPFYIVPQGKITSLCHSKDADRLRIIKEVAGTQTYEDKRQESVKIFDETNLKKEKINEMLVLLDKRLVELRKEQEELAKFNLVNDKHKALKYNLFQLQLNEIEASLVDLESNRSEVESLNSGDYSDTEGILKSIKSLQQSIHQSQLQSLLHQEDKTSTLSSINDQSTQLSKLEYMIQDARQQLLLQSQSSKESLSDLANQLNESKNNLLLLQQQLHYKMQLNSWNQFENHSDVENAINTHIENINNQLSYTKSHLEFLQKQREQQSTTINTTELISRQRELWRNKQQSTIKYNSSKSAVSEISNRIAKSNYTLLLNIQHCATIVKECNLSGYHGPLYQLFECDAVLNTVIDVVANQSLFHVVVDNENTCEMLMMEFNRRSLGRCTFIPLNRIQSKHRDYKQHTSLLSLLTYKPEYSTLMAHVFGKSIVVDENDNISNVEGGLDVLYLNGTRIESSGPMSGGYHGNNKYSLLAELREHQAELDELDNELIAITKELDVLDSAIRDANVANKQSVCMRSVESDIAKYSRLLIENECKLQACTKDVNMDTSEISTLIEQKQTEIKRLTQQMEDLEQLNVSTTDLDVDALDAEYNVLKEALSGNQKLLESLNDKMQELESGLSAMQQELEEKQLQLTKVESKNVQHKMDLNHILVSIHNVIETRNKILMEIEELGVLPSRKLITEFSGYNSDEISRELSSLESRLRVHVNKRANEQYDEYSKQHEELTDRHEMLDGNATRINELLVEMDRKKEETINNTFKSVSMQFQEIFEKIVPGGHADLINTDNGVGINAQFGATMMNMNSLSGGQKTVVALSLLFAIQSVDKQPFYVFDEVDASLDAEYRDSISNLIKEFSKEAQFIVTTFRREIISRADCVYGVGYMNRVSHVEKINKNEALDFVDQVER
eukprot:NODE_345_length_10548_cov_0.306728.p1 type:complete len:1029 gc:universal NODE_345_length_10548_cov_0.306728:3629-6715(+)